MDGRMIERMKWGFPTRKPRKREPKEGQTAYVTDWWTNARNLDGNLWKYQLQKPAQRCLVPFERFSEPKAAAERADPKDLWWWFTVADQEIPCFAGIWKVDEVEGPVYSFLTTEPNALVGDKHQKAMPVILNAVDHDTWLTAPWDEAKGLVSSYPSQLMAMA
jgi:putative SOS response-associated peptidase YedK